MFRSKLLALILFVTAAPLALAEVSRDLTWDDLVPKAAPLEDPFAHLTMIQRVELEIISAARDRKAGMPVQPGRPTYEDVSRFEDRLKSQGLDVDDLLAQYADFKGQIFLRNQKMVDDLNGKFIRMPGYALPLEFNGTGVKEFLLVPYIGACIHVPPPPPNQMVYVSLDRPFKPDDLFTAVWITGRIEVKRTSKSLSLVDGQSIVSAGYAMNAVRVEPFEATPLSETPRRTQ